MTTFYHVTTETSWETIQVDGLVPNIGPRSAEFGELDAVICLFTSMDALNDGLGNWLGELFDERETLIVMSVDMDGLEWQNEVEWEAMVSDAIPSSRLTFLRAE